MIIRRYIFREFLPPFGISLIFFSFVFLLTQLPEIANYVVNFQIGIGTVGLLLLYSMPYFLQFTIPMSAMIAVLLTFLRMSGDMEIVALKAGGVHIYRLLPPVMLLGIIAALLSAYMAIYALPQGRKQTKLMLYNIAAEHVDMGLKPRQFLDYYQDVVIYVHEIDHATKMLSDIFIEDRRSDKMNVTVVAPQGQLSYDREQAVAHLRLVNGTIHQVDLLDRRASTLDFETYDVRLDVRRNLENLKSGEHVQELSLAGLRDRIRSAPPNSDAYFKALKEWHRKFSLPSACLVMTLLAMPLGIRARSSQRAYGVGLGLFFFLVYYVLLSLGWVLAETGAYPPALGMWLPNAVIMGVALILLVRTANEKPAVLPSIPDWLTRKFKRRHAPASGARLKHQSRHRPGVEKSE